MILCLKTSNLNYFKSFPNKIVAKIDKLVPPNDSTSPDENLFLFYRDHNV